VHNLRCDDRDPLIHRRFNLPNSGRITGNSEVIVLHPDLYQRTRFPAPDFLACLTSRSCERSFCRLWYLGPSVDLVARLLVNLDFVALGSGT
jgi:hypothetical protein